MLSRAPVAFLCTRMSFDFASRVSGTRAPDLAILFLFSSVKTMGDESPAAREAMSQAAHRGWRGW